MAQSPIFIGQLQSSLGERVEVWLRHDYGLTFGMFDTSERDPRKTGTGLSIPVHELDNLQNMVMNARVQTGKFQ